MGEKIKRWFLLLSTKKNFIGLKRKSAVLDDTRYSFALHLLVVESCVPSDYNLPFSKVDHDTLMTDCMPRCRDNEDIFAFGQWHDTAKDFVRLSQCRCLHAISLW